MAKGGKSKPPGSNQRAATSRGGGLGAEDEALWRAFSKGIAAGRFKPRVPETEADGAALRQLLAAERHTAGGAKRAAPTPGASPGGTGERNGRTAARAQTVAPIVQRMPTSIDNKTVRRLGSGRMSVDARIDLHGMRQSEAHAALRAFLWRSVARGHRMVLVITGKGGRRTATAQDGWDGGFLGDSFIEPGVLRRKVPMWLREAEFAAIVVGTATAHVRHGGEGALYVQLRARK